MTNAKKIFRAHKAALIKEFGRGPLFDTTINKIGKREFGALWGGAHPYDRIKIKLGHYYVVNTSSHKGKGVHWLGLYVSQSRAYLYDSYDRSIHSVAQHLFENLIKEHFSVIEAHHKPDQIGATSETCGDDSLAWLMTVRDCGIRAALTV